MKRVNNIFYSLQGEGRNTGRAALFVRFAGCNLKCAFCDTEFDYYQEMSDDYIVAELVAHCLDHDLTEQKPMVVLTGGEPTLQVDEAFVDLLHEEDFYVAMESNGLLPAPRNLDWLTVSPKSPQRSHPQFLSRGEGRWVGKLPDEIKIVFDEHCDPEKITGWLAQGLPLQGEPLLYLQPCDTGDAERNRLITARCVDYIKHHPQWRLSLQTHKMIGIE